MMADDIYGNIYGDNMRQNEMSHKISNKIKADTGTKALFFYRDSEPYVTGEAGVVYEVEGFFMTKHDGTVTKDKVIFYGDFERGLKKVQEIFPEYLV